VSVGETLTRARQERGLSVEDVTAATRIRAGLVRAIEADDFNPCGGAVYARGHIRSISRVLGIDSEPLVAEFDRGHLDETSSVVVPAQAPDPEAARAEPKRPNWTAAMAVALVAICILAAVSLITSRGGSQQSADRHGRTPQATKTTPPPASATASPPSGAVAQVPVNTAVALVRVVADRTWLQVWTLDGRELYQGLLSKGDSKIFKNKGGLRLLIGNAPAVDLVANGRDLGAPRSQGNVAHVTIQRGGDVQFA